MSYSVFVLRRVRKELSKLAPEPYEQVKESILNLSENPRPQGCKKLVGRGGWRIRVGDYRVIYEIEDSPKTITVLHVGLRSDIYR